MSDWYYLTDRQGKRRRVDASRFLECQKIGYVYSLVFWQSASRNNGTTRRIEVLEDEKDWFLKHLELKSKFS